MTLENVAGEVKKRGPGRPRKNDVSRADVTTGRAPRVPVSGNRDILTVEGKDPGYMYRWILDAAESGQRIMKFQKAWWDLVDGQDGQHSVGQDMVYKTDNVGSVIRSPAGSGKFYYLMRIPREYYEQDQKAKADDILDREQAITQTDSTNGQYGDIELNKTK